VHSAAEALGYGAVKYFDLRQNPISDYIFSYDRMLDTRGNTAVYLQFTNARLSSIIRKAREEKGIDLASVIAQSEVILDHPVSIHHNQSN
jgi:arginyl-tRNA synthetase